MSAALCCIGASCAAHRTLTVESEPAGAVVRIDDRVVGTTPYTEEFYDYGTRRVTLYMEGYHSLSQVVKLEAPWFGRFPVDILTEVLVPWGWKDPHVVTMVLDPLKGEVTIPDLESVLDRAQALRLAGPEGPSQLPPRAATKPTEVPPDAPAPKPEP